MGKGKGSGKKRQSKRMGKRGSTKKYASSDFARVCDILINELPINATGNGGAGNPSQAYGFYNFALTNSTRAVQAAQCYQEYRISKVEMSIKPAADTFDSLNVSTGTNPSVPYLYYMIDRVGAFDNNATTSQILKNAGAKPIRLDDKTIKIQWKPTVQIGSSDSAGGPAPVSELSAAYKTSPWLTTNANSVTPSSPWVANSVDHMGLTLAVEQPRGPLPVQVASVSVRVTYEFRRPFWYVAPPPGVPAMERVDLDVLGKYPAFPSGEPALGTATTS